MQTGTFARSIERANRNFGLIGSVLLLAATIVVLVNHRFLAFMFFGPEPADRAAILRASPSNMPGQYMRLESVESQEVGTESETRASRVSSRIVARFHAVSIGGNLLIVKAEPDAKGPPFVGTLTRVPDDVRKEILQPAIKSEPELEALLLPVMFDATRDRRFGNVASLLVAAVFAGLGAFCMVRFGYRSADVRHHPSFRELSRFGIPEMVAAEIEADVRALATSPSEICLGTNWAIIPTLFGVGAFRYTDLVWIHVQSTTVTLNFIPIVWSRSAKLYDRYGFEGTVARGLTVNKAEELVRTIAQRAPWALAGHTPQYSVGWQTDRAGMIRYVDEQRARIVALRAQGGMAAEPQAP